MRRSMERFAKTSNKIAESIKTKAEKLTQAYYGKNYSLNLNLDVRTYFVPPISDGYISCLGHKIFSFTIYHDYKLYGSFYLGDLRTTSLWISTSQDLTRVSREILPYIIAHLSIANVHIFSDLFGKESGDWAYYGADEEEDYIKITLRHCVYYDNLCLHLYLPVSEVKIPCVELEIEDSSRGFMYHDEKTAKEVAQVLKAILSCYEI